MLSRFFTRPTRRKRFRLPKPKRAFRAKRRKQTLPVYNVLRIAEEI
ncbi:hypothetical protein [Ferrimonas balearica]|nr:hypothetical protein [Ferrimonas balearica]MBY5920415.1 hypothetical protein [Ferrimonas balearica]MBY5996900.1 hypothetical protein [Ferrimonas balearica]